MKLHSRFYYFKRIFYYAKKKDVWAVKMSIRCTINPYIN